MTYAYKWQLHVNSYSLGFSLSGKLSTSKLSEISHLFRGPFLGEHYNQRFTLWYGTVALSVGLSCLSVTLVYCDQTVGWIKMPLGTKIGLGQGHIALDGDPVPHGKRHSAADPHFSAHGYCGQIAGWITIPLGTEVASALAILCIWGPSSPTERGTTALAFRPCLLRPNGRPSQQLLSSCFVLSRKFSRNSSGETINPIRTLGIYNTEQTLKVKNTCTNIFLSPIWRS